MSRTEDELRATLRRAAAHLTPDTERALAAVDGRARRQLIRRRALAGVAAVAAVVLVALVMSLGSARHPSKPSPVGPPSPSPTSSVRQPFTVTRALPATSLGLSRVLGVAVSPLGYLVVTDRSDRVAEVTTAGRVLRTWGSAGTAPGQFRLQGGGVAVGRDGRIYVSDTGNSRVQVFSAGGRYLTQMGGYGYRPGRLIAPEDLAVDARGDVFVSDDNMPSLTKFAPSGRQIWRISPRSSSDRDLVGHVHFHGFNARGDLVEGNDDAGKVVWVAPDGAKRSVFGSGRSGNRSGGPARAVGEFPHGACDTSTDPAGNVYVLSCEDRGVDHHTMTVFDARERLIGRWVRSPFSTAPVFLPDGTAVFVSFHGEVLEVRVRL